MGKYILSIGLVVIFLASSGCGANPEVQVVEISKNTVIYDEIIRINNCGGKGESEQTATREFATSVEFGAGVSAGYQSLVQGTLSAKYSEYRNTSKSQRLVAPPGTNMEFVLRWSDDVRAGNVQVNGKAGTYEVRIPVSVEQISSRDLGCGVLSTAQQSSKPTIPSQAVGGESSASSLARPSGVTLPSGGTFIPTQGWAWVCTGDFVLIRKDGSSTNLFDELEYTGLIVVFAPDSEVATFAPYGGYCEPFLPEDRELMISSKISTMLNSSVQCQGGCAAVNIKELDSSGNIIRDYWKP